MATATAAIDTVGHRGFTMAEVARRLDVQTMALYTYVSGRDELLDAVVESVLAEVLNDAELIEAHQGTWRGYLTESAWGIRQVALAHPGVFLLVTTRKPRAQQPLSDSWTQSLTRALRRYGLSQEVAATTHRAFAGFLLGHLLPEVMAQGVGRSPVTAPTHGEPHTVLREGRYPVLTGMEQEMRRDSTVEVFQEALVGLLARLDALPVRERGSETQSD